MENEKKPALRNKDRRSPGKTSGAPVKSKRGVLKGLRTKMDSAIDSTVGSRPMLHHSHRIFLKFIRSLGGNLQVQNWGDEKLAWITLPLAGPFARKSGLKKLKRKRRIVFIPGLGDSPVSWMPILLSLRQLLKKEYDELVFLDFPGFGGFLSREKAFDSMDRLLACSMDLLNHLKPEAVIGHSLGGWVASHYAAQNATEVVSSGSSLDPETKSKTPLDHRLKKLLLVSPSGLMGDEKSRKAWVERFDRVTREGFAHLRPHMFHREPFWFKWMVKDVAKFMDSPEIVSFLRSIEDRHLLTDRLPLIEAKTFLLWGEKDSLIPSEWMKEWLSLLSDEAKVSAVYLKGIGHSPHAERPTVLALLLGEIFLGKELLGRVPSPFWKFEHRLGQSKQKSS